MLSDLNSGVVTLGPSFCSSSDVLLVCRQVEQLHGLVSQHGCCQTVKCSELILLSCSSILHVSCNNLFNRTTQNNSAIPSFWQHCWGHVPVWDGEHDVCIELKAPRCPSLTELLAWLDRIHLSHNWVHVTNKTDQNIHRGNAHFLLFLVQQQLYDEVDL